MGVWGYKLFEDDCALDVRGDVRDLIGDGFLPRVAVTKLVKDWSPDPRDPQEYAVFWLALAAAQWDLGRLTPLTLRRALAVIDKEVGIDAYGDAGPRLLAKRRAMLKELRKKLVRKPPPPRPVAKKFRFSTTWKRGHLIAYTCRSERIIYFRVITVHSDKGGRCPIVDICRWTGRGAPSPKRAERLPRLYPQKNWVSWGRDRDGLLALYPRKGSDFPSHRVSVVARGLRVRPYVGGGWFFGGWSQLDDLLSRDYGIE